MQFYEQHSCIVYASSYQLKKRTKNFWMSSDKSTKSAATNDCVSQNFHILTDIMGQVPLLFVMHACVVQTESTVKSSLNQIS